MFVPLDENHHAGGAARTVYHADRVRDIWMDYVKPTSIRVTLQTLTVLWLVFCAVWSVQILWRV
jgi:succinate dehydrogenase / fumarate reductase membrane anchor subunit